MLTKKNKLTATLATSALALTSFFAINSQKVSAATVQNSSSVVTTTHATTVYNSDEKGRKPTGQVLGYNTHWKVIKTDINKQGEKWLDLGKNQWVKASEVRDGYYSNTSKQVTPEKQTPVQSQSATTQSISSSLSSQQTTNQRASSSLPQMKQQSTNTYQSNYRRPATTTYHRAVPTQTQTGSEASAKAEIARRESGGSYTAKNGSAYGKYQIQGMRPGTSPAEQEKIADNYVHARYGSWQNALRHSNQTGWY